jgi:predicted nucleotidyltransferase
MGNRPPKKASFAMEGADMGEKIPGPWFDEIRHWAAEWPRVAAVYAFGPWAKGEQDPDSILDIAIVFGDVASESALVFATNNLKSMHDTLAARLPVAVDLQVVIPGDAVAWPSVEEHGVLICQTAL